MRRIYYDDSAAAQFNAPHDSETDAPDEAARAQLPPVDEVARIMWEGDHDGTWSDPHDGQDESKVIYAENASVALEFIREWRSWHVAQPSRDDVIEVCAQIAENFPVHLYTDGPTAAERSCKPSTFADIARTIRSLAISSTEGK